MIPSLLALSALAFLRSAAAAPAPDGYREPAVFNITTAVAHPDPGAFTATFTSPRTEVLIGAEYEPFNFRHRVYAGGDGENVIPLEASVSGGYDTRREGFFDGAVARVYRIIDGELQLVRRDTVARHRASAWQGTLNNRLVAPDQPVFQWRFDVWNSPISPYYFAVVAVAPDGTHSVPSAPLQLLRPENTSGETANTNIIDFTPQTGGDTSPVPAAPANFAVSVAGDGVLTFTWSPVEGAAGYLVLRSDYHPGQHAGHGLDLAGTAASPAAHIRKGDLVFLDLRRTEYSRNQYNTNRVWNVWSDAGLPNTLPGHAGETDNHTWRLVPHPGPFPAGFDANRRGRTCLEVEMTGGSQIDLFQYCYANAAQEWYHVLKAGRTYVLEFWAKQEGMADPSVPFRTSTFYQNEIREDFTLDGEWRKYTYEFTPSQELPLSEGRVGTMNLRFNGPGTLWLDSWRVYPKDAGYHDIQESEIAALRDSGMRFLRTHSFIKSGWSYFLDDLLSPNGLAATRSTRNSNNPTLHFVLDYMRQAGISPWLQIEMSLSEEEWTGLVEYLAAPYDPAVDTPETKPWAHRRHALGQTAPWTDVFPEFLFEVSNEMWNSHSGFAPWNFPGQQMTDGATGRVYRHGELAGLMTAHVLEQMKQSPYWPVLDAKMETVVGGWIVELGDNGFGQAAVRVAPEIKHNLIANYNGGWDEGTGPGKPDEEGFRQVLTVVPHYLGRKAAEFAATRDRLAAQGVHYQIGSYEAGPGYALPNTISAEQVEQESRLMKSLAAGTATLDVFLDGAMRGMVLQNFFLFSRGRDYWTSHARLDNGGQAYPSWLGLTLFNHHGQGDLLAVQAERAPIDDLVGTNTRRTTRNAPLTSVYATRDGDRYTVFVLSRKLDHFPYADDDGYSPVTLHLPFSAADSITLHTLEGDPRAHNLDEENIAIQTRVIDPAAFSPAFTLNTATGADPRGLPPGATYVYVFEGVQEIPLPGATAAKILPALGQPVVTASAIAEFRVHFDRPVPGFSAADVVVTGSAGGTAIVTAQPDSAGTIYIIRVDDLDGPGDIQVTIPSLSITGPVVRFELPPPENRLLASESFDYAPPDTFWTAEGGHGWKGTWKLHNLNPANYPETFHVSQASPFYAPNVLASPSYLQAGQRYLSAWRTLDVEQAFSRYVMPSPPSGSGPLIGMRGTTLWMSMLMRLDKAGESPRLALHRQAFYIATAAALQAGTVTVPGDPQSYWGVHLRNEANTEWVQTPSAHPVVPGEEVLLVLAITYGREDKVDLYVNPPADVSNPGAPDLALTVAPGQSLAFDKLVIWGGAYQSSSVDEIRFGDTYRAVVPPPDGGYRTAVESDFTGTSPGLNTPWTATTWLSPGLTWSGWRRGAGVFGLSGDDHLRFHLRMPGEEAESTLALALAEDEYLGFSIGTETGALDLRAADLAFTLRRIDWHAPRRFAVFTSVGGFTPGAEVFDTGRFVTTNTPALFTFQLPDTPAYAAVRGPVEVRLYGYAGQFIGHKAALEAFKLSLLDSPAESWTSQDVGSPALAGSGAYDPATDTFTVTGAGWDIWHTSDQFQFVTLDGGLSGDGEIVARVVSQTHTNDWAKAGVMIRDGLAANASAAYVVVTPSNGVAFQYRRATGGQATNVNVAGAAYNWIRLTRSGDTFTAWRSTDGVTWLQVGSAQTILMGTEVQIGLCVTSHHTGALSTVVFDHVTVVHQEPDESWTSQDVGSPALAGSGAYDPVSDTFTVSGAGGDIWGTNDQFHFVTLNSGLSGDGEIIARVASQTNTHVWAKAGVMIRDGLGARARSAYVVHTPASGTAFQYRLETNGQAAGVTAAAGYNWVRLTRAGDTFTAWRSADGVNWLQIGPPQSIVMGDDVRIGLCVTSHHTGALSTVVFDHVAVNR